MLKRGIPGTYHSVSPKHLQRYADEFSGRHNGKWRNALDQLAEMVVAMVGTRLTWKDLVAEVSAPADQPQLQ